MREMKWESIVNEKLQREMNDNGESVAEEDSRWN